MFYVRLAGGHLYGKQLFACLSLVVFFMASFVLSFFPLDVLDGIWDLIESVLRDFLPTQLSSRSQPRHLVGKKDSTKRHHHRHHKRQPGEQQFPIQEVTS